MHFSVRHLFLVVTPFLTQTFALPHPQLVVPLITAPSDSASRNPHPVEGHAEITANTTLYNAPKAYILHDPSILVGDISTPHVSQTRPITNITTSHPDTQNNHLHKYDPQDSITINVHNIFINTTFSNNTYSSTTQKFEVVNDAKNVAIALGDNSNHTTDLHSFGDKNMINSTGSNTGGWNNQKKGDGLSLWNGIIKRGIKWAKRGTGQFPSAEVKYGAGNESELKKKILAKQRLKQLDYENNQVSKATVGRPDPEKGVMWHDRDEKKCPSPGTLTTIPLGTFFLDFFHICGNRDQVITGEDAPKPPEEYQYCRGGEYPCD